MATIALCFWLAFAQTAAEPVRIYPVDDTSRDSAIGSYVRKLQAAVDKRDVRELRKLVDTKDVVVGDEKEDKGWAKFTRRWLPEDRQDAPVWEALSDLLSLGFVQGHPRLFLSPYLTWRFPRNVAIAAPLVVIRDKVALRDAPSSRAEVIAYLSFDIVERLRPPEQRENLIHWVRIRTQDGRIGYLDVRDVRSPAMPRAQFAMLNSRWLLVALESSEP